MTKTAADNLCERLIEWNVKTIYGFPGDGINGILGSLRRHQEQELAVRERGRADDPVAGGEAEVVGEAVTDVVAVQEVGRLTAGDELALERDRDR